MGNRFGRPIGLGLKQVRRSLKNGIIVTILLSLVVHMIILSIHIDLKKFEKSNKGKKIKLVLMKEKPKKDKVKEEKIKKKMQIVNNENTGKKEKVKDRKYLGKMDQKYDRQTIARRVDIFKRAGKGVKSGQKIKRKKSKFSLADLGYSKSSNLYKKMGRRRKKVRPKGQLMVYGQKNGVEGEVGLAANNDYITDLPLGDMTNLNTKEFKYYGYYHRIRQKLEQYWGHSISEKAKMFYRQGRRLAANIDRITSLVVTIDRLGNVLKVFIKGTSGVKELDDAAIESFNKAGPFPNPPKGMLKNGLITINWGFVVRVNG